jgi:hypothetical protein
MALIVEDGTGLANAESYISEADADTYFTAYTGTTEATTWAAATTAGKEAALRIATQYLDVTYGHRWRGVKGSSTQALSWPRDNATDDDGFAIDDESIPVNLERATAEVGARHLADTSILLPDVDTSRSIKSERVKVDVIEEEIEYVGQKPTASSFPKVASLLRGLLVTGGTPVGIG